MIERRWLGRAVLGGTLALGIFCYLRPVRGEKPAASAAVTGPLGERSLYRLDAPFQTDSARPFRLAELRGSFQVLALVFTRCPSVCPTLVHELQALERSMPREVSEATHFTLVSIDPDHDTPAALQAYRSKLGLSQEHWQLLRGEADSVRDLSALLGFSYSSGASGAPLAHSKLVTVLNRDGEIIHQQATVSADSQKIIDVIVHAL
jgi:protein SCO1/2